MGGYTHNFIPNGSLQLWDPGPVPRDMDAQVTNTVLTRLERQQLMNPATYDFIQTQNWADIRDRLDKFTYAGPDSLRATIAAAGAVDAFRIMPEGVAAVALTGASTRHVSVDNVVHRFGFTFAARCSVDGNLIRVRLVLRTAADAVAGFLDEASGEWQAAAAANDFGMTTRWQRYDVHMTMPTPQIIGANIVENMIWQVSNGTAGAQIIDLDDFQITDLENSFAHQ